MILFHCCCKYSKVGLVFFVRKGALNGMSDVECSIEKSKLSLNKMLEEHDI